MRIVRFCQFDLKLDHIVQARRLSHITRVMFSSYKIRQRRFDATYNDRPDIEIQFLSPYNVSIIWSSSAHGSSPRERGPRDNGFRVVYDLDHSSESPAELYMVQAVEDLSWRSCCEEKRRNLRSGLGLENIQIS